MEIIKYSELFYRILLYTQKLVETTALVGHLNDNTRAKILIDKHTHTDTDQLLYLATNNDTIVSLIRPGNRQNCDALRLAHRRPPRTDPPRSRSPVVLQEAS